VSLLKVYPRISAVQAAVLLLLLGASACYASAQDPAAAGQPDAAAAAAAATGQLAEPEPSFEINDFRIEGNTLFAPQRIEELLDPLVGTERGAADVERARDALEKLYHDEGYPTVLVNIPEQSAESGLIRLQVIESRIGATRVTGNRHFSTQQILRSLPALAPGEILYVPRVQTQVAKLNRSADIKVVPAMSPGKALGSVDVEIKTEDHSSWHGFAELNNKYSANTSTLRTSAGLQYDNLWSRQHSLSLQYQVSPQKPSEVNVASLAYTMPAPWSTDDSLVLSGVYSDSDSTVVQSTHTLGKGHIVGTRYLASLPGYGSYLQSAVLGVDYKKFDETTGVGDLKAGPKKTPIEYLPFSLSYSGTLPDAGGLTSFSAGLAWAFRGAVSSQQQFAEKRFKARGNYLTGTLAAERSQTLPGGFSGLFKVDGQLTDQPLISNEQYSAGGMDSVRGYLEGAQAGDNALHAVTEISAPDLAPALGLGERFQLLPYLFYDAAVLWVKEPLPGQAKQMQLQGSGVGLRGFLWRDLQYQLDFALALSDSGDSRAGDSRIHFKLRYQF
jgi:hemolysin activation/secretion protein